MREFEMTNLRLMQYFLGLEIWQGHLKKSKMEDCNPVTTPIQLNMKLFRFERGD